MLVIPSLETDVVFNEAGVKLPSAALVVRDDSSMDDNAR